MSKEKDQSKAPAQTAAVDQAKGFQGNDRLLIGLLLAVLTFWLFAGSAGTIAPQILADINANGNYIDTASLNLAVTLTSLFAGLFTVLAGGFSDRFGRMKLTRIGIFLNIAGSLLLIFAAGKLALPLLLVGRILQGLASACIMPATLAIVNSYWTGPARQRAISIWSMGSWGGAGLSAVFGGTVVTFIGWRGIFVASIAVALLSLFLIKGTPEIKSNKTEHKKFDYVGLLTFIAGTLAIMIVLLYGSKLGWKSMATLAIAAFGIVAYIVFIKWEKKQKDPFIDLSLFKNTTFTGASLSNFLLNTTIGVLIVSQQLIQMAGMTKAGTPYTAMQSGILSIGYGICVITFIRMGEKLLQRFGSRKPMIWGISIVMVAAMLLMSTHLLIGQYVVLAVIAYCLFGTGLAFYATPATDAALSNLPADQSGSGAGIFKMASSLGGASGTAISLAVFYGLMGSKVPDIIGMQGRTDNVQVRMAAMVAIGVSLVFLLLSILSIVTTLPRGGGSKTLGEVSATVSPAKQLPPDEAKAAIVAELGNLSISELEEIRKQILINKLAKLDIKVLERLVDKQDG
ncbi:MAG TPA: MFS transporter [Mogibacterium sp.]|nr:MFS transporter [Mogibacterium sp.]